MKHMYLFACLASLGLLFTVSRQVTFVNVLLFSMLAASISINFYRLYTTIQNEGE